MRAAMSSPVTSPIRLLLVDDHAMFREGVARMLEKETDFIVAGQVKTATEALDRAVATGASVVLLDVDLGTERAIDFASRAHESGFEGRILVLTAGISDREAIQLVQNGVIGIIHKHHSTEVLCSAIRQVAKGEAWLEKTYLGSLLRTVDRTRAPGRLTLTERDRTVLRYLLQGLTNREMAARIDVSEGAVKASLRHVGKKLGVRTRTQLVKVALEQFKHQL
jgi:two-component system nitrate/nitrite response regulator NarL